MDAITANICIAVLDQLAYLLTEVGEASFNVTVTSMSVRAAALEAEVQKHRANDPMCSELRRERHMATGAKKLMPHSPA